MLSPFVLLSAYVFGLVSGLPLSTQDLACPAPVTSSINGTVSVGQAIVVNNCDYDVYLVSVAGKDIDDMVTLNSGDDYSEEYHLGPDGAGVAIKITDNPANWSTPMLLEYSPDSTLNMVFYDMSVSVGGDKQGTGGIGDVYELVPSVLDPAVNCVSVVYNSSYVDLGESDDATKSCPLTTSLTLRLC